MLDFFQRLEQVPGQLSALEDEHGNSLSYAELGLRLREVAAGLLELGLQPGQLVGLQLPKGQDYVVALLACWWAGLAFVPLDPGLPQERLLQLKAAADPDLVLKRLPQGAPGPRRYHDLAYVIATSGSSGRPKAVEIEHRGLLPMLEDQIEAFRLTPRARSLWLLSIQFDASLSDLGTALLSGACLVVPSSQVWDELPRQLRQRRITHLDLPPALLRAYEPQDFPDGLETLIVGGEPSDPERLRRWAERFRVVSVYGPTEATICTSLRQVDASWTRPYLGRPIGGTEYRIVEGELWIAGPLLARGYRHQPEATAAAFPWLDGRRYYRSGDRVKSENDDLVFLGRNDRQLKIRGHRIEAEEIEQHLLAIAGVVRAAVLAQGGRLLAFFEGPLSSDEVADRLRQRLPKWMLPDGLERRPSLPLLPSGKVDLEALRPAAPAPLDSLQALQHIALLQSRGQPAQLTEWLQATPLEVAGKHLAVPTTPYRPPAQKPTASHILFTGATGMLGSAWLQRLKGYRITLLGRRGPEGYPLVQQDFNQELRLEALEDCIDSVIHCAGDINMLAPFERLRACNLEATHQLIEFCQRGRPKSLHFASTLSIFAHSSFRGRAREQAPLDPEVVLFGGYTQSKWAAEFCLRNSGVPLFCYRYGLLCGSPRDFLQRFVRGLVELGCHPQDTRPRLDLTPVDWAAEASWRFFRADRPGTVHIAHPRGASLEDIVAHLRQQGYILKSVSAEEFFALSPQSADQGAAQLALARLHPHPEFRSQFQGMDLFPMEGLEFELEALKALGMPDLPEGQELVRRCMG